MAVKITRACCFINPELESSRLFAKWPVTNFLGDMLDVALTTTPALWFSGGSWFACFISRSPSHGLVAGRFSCNSFREGVLNFFVVSLVSSDHTYICYSLLYLLDFIHITLIILLTWISVFILFTDSFNFRPYRSRRPSRDLWSA